MSGDIIVVSVKEAIPRGRVKKGEVLKAWWSVPAKGCAVRWQLIRFDGNAAVWSTPRASRSVPASSDR